MLEKLVLNIVEATGSPALAVFLISMLPLVELKGGIPFGVVGSFNLAESFLFAYLGSTFAMLPVYFLLRPLLTACKKCRAFRSLAERVERLVAELGEGRPGSLDLIRSPLGEPAALLSREAVVAAGGFGMRPLRGIPRGRRRRLWEPLLAAPRSGTRMPGWLRGLAAASLAAAFAAATAAGWWTSAAALATLALVWAGGECAARLAGGTAFSAPGGLTAWRRLFGHY